ncbi:hypothetical protein BTN50_0336 [Candidatus Enterovibrio altilux]|uniref:Uncharacterized protein n=1 Tax=Candidatus Enterovibrio altilux TaxID=1927128 RepID=A0A291B792_9GAMM|nr:hypothetical protein BTN50_0336 [Candidatus Enterovibrio luxaltus]
MRNTALNHPLYNQTQDSYYKGYIYPILQGTPSKFNDPKQINLRGNTRRTSMK